MWWNSLENNSPKYPLQKIEALIGFAARAGKVISGDTATRGKFRKGAIFLIVLAEDASAEIVDYYIFKAKELQIPIVCSGTKLDLGLAIGKSPRAVLGIVDRWFAESIVKQVREKKGMD